jgi:hypothetical protein
MQNTANKKGQPWWLILLIIPMLVSCNPIFKVALFIGDTLIASATGEIIEIIIDTLVKEIFDKFPPGHVITDEGNLLQGYYSKDMTFKSIDYLVLHQPRMCRDSETSKWELAPNEQKKVLCVINSKC